MTEGAEVLRRQPFGDNPEVGARGASTRHSILAAALGVFADQGFHDTNVELISSAAGCSRPAFYQYFSSKEDVFWRLAGHLARDLARLVDRVGEIEPDAGGVHALHQWLDELVDVYIAYRPVFISFQAAFREHEPHQALPRTVTPLLVQAMSGASRRRGVTPIDVDPDTLGDATVAMILRSIHYWLLELIPVERPRFTASLASTVHRVLFGAIDEVNIGPSIGAPSRTVPPWPEVAASSEVRALRPRGRQTRQDLLDAGGKVLPLRGFHDARVDDIVAEAGCSHGSFYRYFENKDALFQVLALQAGEAMAALVDAFPTDLQAVQPWLATWFATYRSNGGILSTWQEIGVEESAMTPLSLDLAFVFFDRLERVVHARGFGDTSVDAVALLAVLEHVPYNVLVLGNLDEAQAVSAADHIIRRGIFGV
ncbi:MAG: TetR/AcrR family transcriptional regulator [Acidimicrobiales bacterium]